MGEAVVATYVVPLNLFMNVNDERKPTRAGHLLTESRRSLLGVET
jgi:hypothetical protein